MRMDKAPEARKLFQESWLIFKVYCLLAQELFIPRSRKPHKNAKRHMSMNGEFLVKLKHSKEVYRG